MSRRLYRDSVPIGGAHMRDSVPIGGDTCRIGGSTPPCGIGGSTPPCGIGGSAPPCGVGRSAPRETARRGLDFSARVLETFLCAENVDYLGRELPGRGAILPGGLYATMEAFARGAGRDLLIDDPLLRRTADRRSTGLWPELRRLNRAFLDGRREVARTYEPMLRGDTSFVEEDYAFSAFEEDSLRLPGHTGPTGRGVVPQGAAAASNIVTDEDDAWGEGQADRSAADAWTEYYGEASSHLVGDRRCLGERGAAAGPAHANPLRDGHAYGGEWTDNFSGGRTMRREFFPVWQQAGGRNHESDIQETLGLGGREHAGQVRLQPRTVARRGRLAAR